MHADLIQWFARQWLLGWLWLITGATSSRRGLGAD
jgi:hypothetical protein